MAKEPINIREELGGILNGESLEYLENLLAFGNRPGRMARSGAVFAAIGDKLTGMAKDAAMIHPEAQGGMFADDGVMFEWRDAYTTNSVDSHAVKKLFPKEDYPDLYTVREVAGTVVTKLPFDKNAIA